MPRMRKKLPGVLGKFFNNNNIQLKDLNPSVKEVKVDGNLHQYETSLTVDSKLVNKAAGNTVGFSDFLILFSNLVNKELVKSKGKSASEASRLSILLERLLGDIYFIIDNEYHPKRTTVVSFISTRITQTRSSITYHLTTEQNEGPNAVFITRRNNSK